jgi:predicted kinase
MRANEFIQEGVNDPAIFKVVFVIGGPGSGKSYVSRQLGLNAMGFVTVNSDVAFEYLMGKHGIDPKMPPEEKEKRDVVRARAKEITGKKSDLAIEGRLGIHIDGTGDDYDKVANLKKNFERLGYDCYLVVVNTRLEVARQRNQMRARTVPDKIVTNSWYDVQDNIGRFANIFTYMSIIDNSGDAKSTDAQITKVHSRLQQFADSKPTKPAAKEWIANQKKVSESFSDLLKGAGIVKDKLKKSFIELKRILSTESQETKQMLFIINRLAKGDKTVTQDEKKEATEQFFDIIKLAGLGTFMAFTLKIPFSTEGMLVASRIMHKYLGINILPSSLKEEPAVNEKWSQKYKRSIDCAHPKGFSQRAHCQGRKKKAS